MQKVLTAEQMREVDRLTVEKYGIPFLLLMENAAHAAANVIKEKLGGSVAGKSFLILCGKGNNGGDGAALARILWTQGAKVEVYSFVEVEKTKGEARTNFEILENLSQNRDEENLNFTVDVEDCWVHSTGTELDNFDVFVDALFGSGLTKPISSSLQNLPYIYSYQRENSRFPFFVSLDIPSGLNADLSEPIGENFQADLTITFTAPKLANVLPPASNFNGELVTVNVGSPLELVDNCGSQLYLTERSDAQDWLSETAFKFDSYKKTRGHALIIAGSKNMSGAAVLCADSAMQSGVGLVTIATPDAAQTPVASRVKPEIMVLGFDSTESGAISETALQKVLDLSAKMNAVAIGCGLGSSEETTRKFVRGFIENRKTPVVIDADALNALAPFDLRGSDELPIILTPHIGEMRRLLGVDETFDFTNRVSIVREFAQKHHVILVLKGERALIANEYGDVVINPTGNSGLGKAGNGDTLTGIICGFIAQTVANQREPDIFQAVVAALYIAGLAGDIAARNIGKRSMLASDVRESLREAFQSLEK
ncbi:MAG: NAD(P)H-hydrate dehydratase [Pyrinomonadaceae bacterium]|nr:NAD(P)H-hydrate dehydratase [Pyrinomonadaceae bacterium]